MNRRSFLRNAALPLATQVASADQSPPKRLLITSGASKVAQALAAALKDRYQVRLTERVPVETQHEFVQCVLGHDRATNLLVHDMDGIVHVAEPLAGDDGSQQIDYLTRCTFNLLWAAAEEKAPPVVFLSTLDVMAGYPVNFTVGENWRPKPTPEPRVLAKHLGEFTCREFARENRIGVVVLRLGKVVRADDVKDQAFDPMWVDERDVAQAVSGALTATTGRWSVFHIQADSPRARFRVTKAKAELGYNPQFNW